MDLGLLMLGGALVTAAAVLLAASVGLDGWSQFVAGGLLLAAAMVVVESIVLSLVHLLTGPALLGAQALCVAGAAAVWVGRGRPTPPPLRPPRPRELARMAAGQPLLAVLIVVAAAALALQAVLAVAVAPNEADSISYHLPRAAYWVQNHSALQYAPRPLDDPTQAHPPNAELLVAWTMALSHSDSYAQLVQWLAMIGAIAAIFSGARLAGLPRAQAAFSACVFALLPEPIIQAATTQNDLLLTFLLVAGLGFAVSGLQTGRRGPLAVAAIAVGLAVGTKLDFVFIAPAALLIIGATLRRHRPPGHLIRFGVLATATATLALGSFVYVQNEINTQTPTGFSGTPNGDFIKANPLIDAARTAWNLVEAPSLPVPDWMADPAERVVARLFHGLHGSYFGAPDPAIADYASADSSGYGLVGLLILLPLLGVCIVRRRGPGWARLLAVGAAGYFVAYSLALGYNPESGRYLMPAVGLAAPLFGLLGRRRRWAGAIVVLLVASLPGALLHETYKPLLASGDTPSILALDRIDQQTIDDTALRPALHRLALLVGAGEPLAFVGQDNLSDYFLFGEPLARRLVGFESGKVTSAQLRTAHIRRLFIAFADQPPCAGRFCVGDPAGFHFIALGGTAYLAEVTG